MFYRFKANCFFKFLYQCDTPEHKISILKKLHNDKLNKYSEKNNLAITVVFTSFTLNIFSAQ